MFAVTPSKQIAMRGAYGHKEWRWGVPASNWATGLVLTKEGERALTFPKISTTYQTDPRAVFDILTDIANLVLAVVVVGVLFRQRKEVDGLLAWTVVGDREEDAV